MGGEPFSMAQAVEHEQRKQVEEIKALLIDLNAVAFDKATTYLTVGRGVIYIGFIRNERS